MTNLFPAYEFLLSISSAQMFLNTFNLYMNLHMDNLMINLSWMLLQEARKLGKYVKGSNQHGGRSIVLCAYFSDSGMSISQN